jgi:hypothetical protein
MLKLRVTVIAVVLLTFTHAVCAQEYVVPKLAPDQGPKLAADQEPKVDRQIMYKGVVGKVLDSVPMDPVKRAKLQRTNAVVGNTITGRSLAVLAGVSVPPLMIVGFIWGLFSASKIKPEESDAQADARADAESEQPPSVVINRSSVLDPAVDTKPETITLIETSALLDATFTPHIPVIKLWLPQPAN